MAQRACCSNLGSPVACPRLASSRENRACQARRRPAARIPLQRSPQRGARRWPQQPASAKACRHLGRAFPLPKLPRASEPTWEGEADAPCPTPRWRPVQEQLARLRGATRPRDALPTPAAAAGQQQAPDCRAQGPFPPGRAGGTHPESAASPTPPPARAPCRCTGQAWSPWR